MNSTSAEATSNQAVFAASSLGGSAASASGTCITSGTSSHFLFTVSPPFQKHILANILGVEAKRAAAAVGEPVPEGRRHGPERDQLPGDGGLLEKLHFQGLLARLELQVAEPR